MQNTTSTLVPGINPAVSKVTMNDGSKVLLQELVMGQSVDADQAVKSVVKKRRRLICSTTRRPKEK